MSIALLLPSLLLSSCNPALDSGDSAASSRTSSLTDASAPGVAIPDAARTALRQDGHVRVILEWDSQGQPRARLERPAFFSALKQPLLAQLPREGLTLDFAYDQLPMAAVPVTSEAALNGLATLPGLAAIYADETLAPALTESLDVIDQPTAELAGFTGAGTAVAVLDSGLDYTRDAFGPCTAVGEPADTCRVAFMQDFAPSDSVLDASTTKHGSNVAGIVAAVAPGTQLLGLDVMRTDTSATASEVVAAINWVVSNAETYNIVAMSISLATSSFATACTSSTYNTPINTAYDAGILTVAPSGNAKLTTKVAAPGCVANAITVGATYDADLGSTRWASVNCTDTAVTDMVACFSNSSSLVDMWAPGAQLTAAGVTIGGTSQAAAHVAGAVAVVRQAFPYEPASESVLRLVRTGLDVTDARNSITRPRLDLGAAAEDCITSVTPASNLPYGGGTVTVNVTAEAGCYWDVSTDTPWITLGTPLTGTGTGSFTLSAPVYVGVERAGTLTVAGREVEVLQDASPDLVAPAGRVLISADAEYVASTSVTLTIEATDDRGTVSEMCLANSSSSCSSWVSYATTASWTLGGSGPRSVYVWFRDPSGNATAFPSSDAVIVDTGTPTSGTLTAAATEGSVALSWSGASDALSGVASYRLVFAEGSAPADCASGTLLYSGTDATFTHDSLTDGTTYAYRLCAIDNVGNTSAGTTATATPRDTTPPTDGTLTVAPGDTTMSLSWDGFVDPDDELDSYIVVFAEGDEPPADCEEGEVLYEGPDTTFEHTGLVNGTDYSYRVCALDLAGNVSPGVTATDAPVDSSAPVGELRINGGATYVRSARVTLTLTPDDPDVSEMCISNTTTCERWIPYQRTMTWNLAATSGAQSVYAWFRDADGNTSEEPSSVTVNFDTAPPSGGVATVANGTEALTVSWTGVTDRLSGVARYELVYATGRAPSNCDGGSLVWTGTGTSATVSHLTNGTTYYFRVCAIDAVGNRSNGVTTAGRPAPELDGPTTLSLTIDDDDGLTNAAALALTLSAEDDSGVTSVCLSTTPTCTAWVTYAESLSFTHRARAGELTIYAKFRDTYGNVSAEQVSDTITFDNQAPTNGSVTPTVSGSDVSLAWTGFTDTLTDVASYKVVTSASRAPSTCTTGTVVYEGADATATATGLAAGTHGFRVCAIDGAGNVSRGTAVVATVP